MPPGPTLHASCVALPRDGAPPAGVLILGASGSGKSALALSLMALGLKLVADDRVTLARDGDHLSAACPPAILGRIEARFVGILSAPALPEARIALAVDLDRTETERLPPRRSTNMLGLDIPLLHNVDTHHFPPAILGYLFGGRAD
jgi:HPr kinase/phosphorylase